MTKAFFISYAHNLDDDRALALFLQDGLTRAGYTVFIDVQIPFGARWEDEISQHIASCDFMIVLISSHSVESNMVKGEVRLAYERYKQESAPRFLPIRVRYDGALGYELGSYILPFQHRNWQTAADSQPILDEIVNLVTGRPLVEPSSPTVVQPNQTWHDILEQSHKQTKRFLWESQHSRGGAGRFIPDVYVHRSDAQRALQAFQADETLGLLLIGASGSGKTNVLCQWTLDLLQAGHAVFVYVSGASLGLEIDRELIRDLSPYISETLPAILKQVDDLAAQQGRQVVIIFDSINEFRSGQAMGPEDLLKRIDGLVESLPGQNIRVIVSCSEPTWHRLHYLNAIQLYWSRYYCATSDEPLVRLGDFTPVEFDDAYRKYQAFFRLGWRLEDLPSPLRDRLHHPLLLRLVADTYGGRDESMITTPLVTLHVYQRYVSERVRHPRDRTFIDALAAEMLIQQRAALPLTDLVHHPVLGRELLHERADSSYYRLLDNGIVSEVDSDWGMGQGVVKFTYPLVGAYTLAVHLRNQPISPVECLTELINQAGHFSLAWDTARTFLLLHQEGPLFASLASSNRAEMRELVSESLVALYTDDPSRAKRDLQQLLESDAEAAQRTALKAAYRIGPGARDLFLWVAENKGTNLRQLAQDALYLIWRRDPDFTYGLLHELLSRIKLSNLKNFSNILDFVINLSITIYINHCHEPDVIDRTVELYYELATERLYLQLLRTDIFGPGFEKRIIRTFASAFSTPILKAMLATDFGSAEDFFRLPAADRACLKRIAPAVDPQADLESVRDDLFEMLQSDVTFFNILAALILGVHACQNFSAIAPLLRQFFDHLNARGRLWELLSFAILLPETPAAWVELLEQFTQRLLQDHPELLAHHDPALTGQLNLTDFMFVPLGLAYGKRGTSMPLIQSLVCNALSHSDRQVGRGCIAALGPVGFYYPDAVFAILQTCLSDVNDPQTQEALVQSLAVIRTLHFDAVDIFMAQHNMDEAFQRRVSAAADVTLVHRYISLLGFYNNAVHFSQFYPKMRQAFSIGAMQLLSEAKRPKDFISDYTIVALRLFREADFRLSAWTVSDAI